MPSSYTSSARLTLQATGENNNTWGVILNDGVFQLVDDLVCGVAAFVLSGPKVLTTVNGADDEARKMILDITGGTGGTITIPSVSKIYIVRNTSGGDANLTTGSGAVATIRTGNIGWVICDGTNCRALVTTDMGGQRITNVGTPIVGTDAATKAYADGLAFGAANLPGQGPGTVARPVISDGVVASWGGAQMPRTLNSGFIYAETSGGVRLPGIVGTDAGTVGFVDAAGNPILSVNPAATEGSGLIVYGPGGAPLRAIPDLGIVIAMAVSL